MPRGTAGQLSLLDWQPPAATTRFDDERVCAATIETSVCLAISAALQDCDLSRATVAERMSVFLGERVSVAMLNAYASQARDAHRIGVTRFIALIHVTRDRRLLHLLAERFGWAVIDRRHLPLIELAAVQDRTDELRRHADVLRRQARSGGAL